MISIDGVLKEFGGMRPLALAVLVLMVLAVSAAGGRPAHSRGTGRIRHTGRTGGSAPARPEPARRHRWDPARELNSPENATDQEPTSGTRTIR